MNKFICLISIIFFATFAPAAETISRSELLAASQKLANLDNYTVDTTYTAGAISTTETVRRDFRNNRASIYMTNSVQEAYYAIRCGRTLVKIDGNWQFPKDLPPPDKTNLYSNLSLPGVLATLEQSNSPASYFQNVIQFGDTDFVRLSDGSYGGDVPSRPWSLENPEWLGNSDQKIRLKIWSESGRLKKYELKTINVRDYYFDGPIEYTIIVEIRNIGTTKVVIPPEARKKLLK